MDRNLRPSGADIWGYCSGSVAPLNEDDGIPRLETRDGTAAHWLGAELLRMYKAFGARPSAETFKGRTCPDNGVVIDDDHIEGAEIYVDVVVRKYHEIGGDLHIEVPLEMPQIHPRNRGTSDVVIINVATKRIVVLDYKHGHSKIPARSFQLVDYLAGVYNWLGLDGGSDGEWFAELILCQPFCYQNEDVTVIDANYVSDYRGDFNRLHGKAWESENNPILTSGSHCYYCPALWKCPASRKHAYRLFDYVAEAPTFDEMDGGALATERAILQTAFKLAKGRLEGIEDVLTERVKSGDRSVPLTIESVKTRRKWTADKQYVYNMGLAFGVDFRIDKPITPTQAAKLKPEAAGAIEKHSQHGAKLELIPAENSKTARAFKPKGN